MDYESETPPSLSPVVDDNSEPENRLRTPVPGEADDSDPDDGFCEIPAGDAVMAGTKQRRIFQQLPNKDDVAKDVMAALPRKGGKTFYSAEADEDDKDVMAALPRKGVRPFFLLRRMMMTKTLWQPLQGGAGRNWRGCRISWAMLSCCGVMNIMLSHSMSCHAGPCHHAVM